MEKIVLTQIGFDELVAPIRQIMREELKTHGKDLRKIFITCGNMQIISAKHYKTDLGCMGKGWENHQTYNWF